MFERFTERARQVVVMAQEESRTHKHSYIGTEHILLGLLREEEGLAARTLESFDVTLEKVRAIIQNTTGFGETEISGQIPFTPRGKKVLELSLREALSLGHNYIGTEHILLGLIREGEGIGYRILAQDFELTADQIRNEIIRMLSGPGGRRLIRQQSEEATKQRGVPPEEQAADSHSYPLEPGQRLAIVREAVALGDGMMAINVPEVEEDHFQFGDRLRITIEKVDP